jgi:hypothetical protein
MFIDAINAVAVNADSGYFCATAFPPGGGQRLSRRSELHGYS